MSGCLTTVPPNPSPNKLNILLIIVEHSENIQNKFSKHSEIVMLHSAMYVQIFNHYDNKITTDMLLKCHKYCKLSVGGVSE